MSKQTLAIMGAQASCCVTRGVLLACPGGHLASCNHMRGSKHVSQALVVPVQPLLDAPLVAATHLLPVPDMLCQQRLHPTAGSRAGKQLSVTLAWTGATGNQTCYNMQADRCYGCQAHAQQRQRHQH